MIQKESNLSESAISTAIKHNTTKVDEINKCSVDVSVEVGKTIKYTSEIVSVQGPNITKSQTDTNISFKDSDKNITEIANSNGGNYYEDNPISFLTSIKPTSCSENYNSHIYDQQNQSCHMPRTRSFYENVQDGLEDIPLYVDGTDNFDSAVRDYYLSRHSKPQKEEPSLQDRIKENSDHFNTYLKKYGDNIGSSRNTDPPVLYSTKSSNAEVDILTLEAESQTEATESQIIQDINTIEHTLQLIQYANLDYDVPKQFSLDSNDAEVLQEIDESLVQKNHIPQKVATHRSRTITYPSLAFNDNHNISRKTNGNDKTSPEKTFSFSNNYNLTPPPNSRL